MTAGIILVLVMLILGGAIATISDRLGTKVGKARLSLFKLRPRDTAVLVTVFTGSVLSALTLTILFAASKPLRTGVFQIDEIQKRLRNIRGELDAATRQKSQVEVELAQARKKEEQAKSSLEKINVSLNAAIASRTKIQNELNSLREQLTLADASQKQKEEQLNQTQSQLKTVLSQKMALNGEISQLQGERQQLIQQRDDLQAQIALRDREKAQRDEKIVQQDQEISQISQQKKLLGSELDKLQGERQQSVEQLSNLKERIAKLKEDLAVEIAQRDRMIIERDKVIVEREKRMKELESLQGKLEQQQGNLKAQLKILEQDFLAIRGGTVVIRRGRVLASGVVRILQPNAAGPAVDQLLQEANRNSIGILKLPTNEVKEQVVFITKNEVDQITKAIENGDEYVVQIVADANYLSGETKIKVGGQVYLNRILFKKDELIAGISLDPTILTEAQIRQQLQQLIDSAHFRANLVGILGGKVELVDTRLESLLKFIQELKTAKTTLEIQAIASEETRTAGPLKLELVALDHGTIVFRSGK